jgi:hypothetical protein
MKAERRDAAPAYAIAAASQEGMMTRPRDPQALHRILFEAGNAVKHMREHGIFNPYLMTAIAILKNEIEMMEKIEEGAPPD